jgi:hypothetical protein
MIRFNQLNLAELACTSNSKELMLAFGAGFDTLHVYHELRMKELLCKLVLSAAVPTRISRPASSQLESSNKSLPYHNWQGNRDPGERGWLDRKAM